MNTGMMKLYRDNEEAEEDCKHFFIIKNMKIFVTWNMHYWF